VEKHPARPHCWWWKDTLHVHIAGGGQKYILNGGGKTLYASTLLVVEMDTFCTSEANNRNAGKQLDRHRHFP
jgi:hypothetical protein